MENPSIHQANEVLRVLSDEKLKYTVRVHLPDKVIEFQTATRPSIKYFDEDRALWLCSDGYSTQSIMKWIEGSILLVEENKV